jgi:hypothetical protein
MRCLISRSSPQDESVRRRTLGVQLALSGVEGSWCRCGPKQAQTKSSARTPHTPKALPARGAQAARNPIVIRVNWRDSRAEKSSQDATNLAYSSADEERDDESQTADNQISLLVSRLRTHYSAWSVVFPTLFPSLPSVKNPFRDAAGLAGSRNSPLHSAPRCGRRSSATPSGRGLVGARLSELR